MTSATDVFFYVQHLLGIGHLRRAAAIARAMSEQGLSVVLVSGGLPVPDLSAGSARVIELPPLQSLDETFSVLADAEGRPVDDAWKARRRERLLAAYREARPRMLLTEMFPFGRRQMRFELLPLLEAAREAAPKPAIVCSLRDILNAARKPEKTEWIVATVNRCYDRILVHGDPEVVRLDATFPEAGRLEPEIDYTGYVVTDSDGPTGPGGTGPEPASAEVLVSAGGGRVAGPLVEAALTARPLGPLAQVPWRILVGQHFPADAFDALVRQAPKGVSLERSRPDFQSLLAGCRLSISQAGYNTVMEVLRAGCPAVVVPFAAAGETEQSLRAALLEARGVLTIVPEAGLSGATLDSGIRRALASADRHAIRHSLRLDGAEATARILRQMLDILPR